MATLLPGLNAITAHFLNPSNKLPVKHLARTVPAFAMIIYTLFQNVTCSSGAGGGKPSILWHTKLEEFSGGWIAAGREGDD